ncbi:hypothetical protein EBR57_09495 [bacterium]|nr:hypothetical protein [bacterium]
MLPPKMSTGKPTLADLLTEFKSIMGDRYTSIMVSDKWMAHHDQSHYFILTFSGKTLRLLERTQVAKTEYELTVATGVFKINNEEKNRSFMTQFLEKVEKISGMLVHNQVELFFKEKEV